MKKLLLLACLLIVFSFAKAQSPMFLSGDKLLNVGAGLRNYPVVSASIDYCIVDDIADLGSIGVGPYAGLGVSSSALYVSAGARGTFHYPIIDDLDTYAGIGVGFRYTMWRYWSNNFHLVPSFCIGANYPVNDNIIVFGELGSGGSYLTVGITLFI